MMGDEPAANAPRIPDLFVGRIPADRDPGGADPDWELRNVVHKILVYEPIPNSAGWVDSLLMVSGSEDGSFDHLPAPGTFEAFFDSVSARSIPPTKTVAMMLSPGESYTFSAQVAQEMTNNYWVTGLFDHGSPYYVKGAVYPQHYDTLANVVPTVLFSGGSNTGRFDITVDSLSIPVVEENALGPWCALNPSVTSIGCRSATTLLDSTDVLTERMLLMPHGAIGVLGYSRTTNTTLLQRTFSEFYDALFNDNIATLGQLLMATKMRTLDPTDIASFMLMGDPLLNIRWQEGVSDSVDFVVAPTDIRSATGSSYWGGSDAELTVTVHNLWWKDATGVVMEIWDGEPEGVGSTMLDSVVLDIDGHGIFTNNYELELAAGTHEIFVILDAEDDYDEVLETNNIASKKFLVVPSYEPGFPRKLTDSPQYSITLADLAGSDSLEILARVGDDRIECFTIDSGQSLWSFNRPQHSRGAPLVGRFLKSQDPCVVFEAGTANPANPSNSDFYLYILDGETGAAVDSIHIAEAFGTFNAGAQTSLITDLDPMDQSLEVVVFNTASLLDSLHLSAFSLNGTSVFSTTAGTGATLSAAMAVADINGDGSKEILVSRGQESSDGDELRVFRFAEGVLEVAWTADLYQNVHVNRVVPVDLDGDGQMEIFANGGVGTTNDQLFRLESDGSSPTGWPIAIGDNPFFVVHDIDGDGDKEIVLLTQDKVQIINPNTGTEEDSGSINGTPQAPPYLVDIDSDGVFEIVAYTKTSFNYGPVDGDGIVSYHLAFYDAALDPVIDEMTFPPEGVWNRDDGAINTSAAAPAIADIDVDGVLEVVYASPDSVLHAFEIGTQAGEIAWGQRFHDPMHTNVIEQPIKGTYTDGLSLFGNVRMLDTVHRGLERSSLCSPWNRGTRRHAFR